MPDAHAFLRRYRLLTVLLPAYALALLYYGLSGRSVLEASAALVRGEAAGAALWGWPLLLGLAGLLGYLRIIPLIGFFYSGVPGRRVEDPVQADRLTALLGSTGLPLLAPVLLDLQGVPYLAVTRDRPLPRLWISRWLAQQTPDATLRCWLAHEQAHAAHPPPVLDWVMLSWLIAFPLCWLTRGFPLAWAVLAALHVSLWLRWQASLTSAREAAADRQAAQAVGRDAYAAALAAHLAQFETPGSARLRAARLRGLGLSGAEIAELLPDTIASRA
jgi:hypothetical protein